MKNKNGIEYNYIINRILLEFPDKSPEDIECFLETLEDFDLLSKEGAKVRSILVDSIYRE